MRTALHLAPNELMNNV